LFVYQLLNLISLTAMVANVSKFPLSSLLKRTRYSIRVSCFLLLKHSFLSIFQITIANGQKTQQMNVTTENSTFSRSSKIKHCTTRDNYVIKTGNRLCTLHNQHRSNHDMLLTKTYPRNIFLFVVI